MLGDPLHPAAPDVPLVDGIGREMSGHGIDDELYLDPVVLEGVVKLV